MGMVRNLCRPMKNETSNESSFRFHHPMSSPFCLLTNIPYLMNRSVLLFLELTVLFQSSATVVASQRCWSLVRVYRIVGAKRCYLLQCKSKRSFSYQVHIALPPDVFIIDWPHPVALARSPRHAPSRQDTIYFFRTPSPLLQFSSAAKLLLCEKPPSSCNIGVSSVGPWP